MADPANTLVTVIGGSGFIGRHIVRELIRSGYRVRVAVRRPDLAGHLQPLGGVGQVAAVQANLRYPESVAAACDGADAVINLVGVLYNSGPQTFEALHVRGADVAAHSAKQAGARTFVQMSAIGADPASGSAYGRSKAEGEARVRQHFSDAIIVRPSVVFGPEDDLFNKFAAMARFSPALPLIGGATRFQPVFAGDVAKVVATLVRSGAGDGKAAFELGGPDICTFRELLEFILRVIDRQRLLVPVPFAIAKMKAAFLGMLPKPLLTLDQVEMLKVDNVVSDEAIAAGCTLEGLGIEAESMEAVVPAYLYRYRKAGQFSTPHQSENGA